MNDEEIVAGAVNDIRRTLGSERMALANDIVRLVSAFRQPHSPAEIEGFRALEDMRRGLDIALSGFNRLKDCETVLAPRGTIEVRLLAPQALFLARAWLNARLPSRHRGGRPKDEARVRDGVTLAWHFAMHGEPISRGRGGLFAKTLAHFLTAIGRKAPEDLFDIIRDIYAEHARRLSDPGFQKMLAIVRRKVAARQEAAARRQVG
jgi:hypothetical protein